MKLGLKLEWDIRIGDLEELKIELIRRADSSDINYREITTLENAINFFKDKKDLFLKQNPNMKG